MSDDQLYLGIVTMGLGLPLALACRHRLGVGALLLVALPAAILLTQIHAPTPLEGA